MKRALCRRDRRPLSRHAVRPALEHLEDRLGPTDLGLTAAFGAALAPALGDPDLPAAVAPDRRDGRGPLAEPEPAGEFRPSGPAAAPEASPLSVAEARADASPAPGSSAWMGDDELFDMLVTANGLFGGVQGGGRDRTAEPGGEPPAGGAGAGPGGAPEGAAPAAQGGEGARPAQPSAPAGQGVLGNGLPVREAPAGPGAGRAGAGAGVGGGSPGAGADDSSPVAALTPAVAPVLVTGADAGGAPRVKVFHPATGALKLDFLAFPAAFTGGVRVAAADVNGDGTADVVAGVGRGGGSQVRVFNGLTGAALPGALGGFSAFAAGATNGVYVAAGDVNADGKADVIVGTDAAAGAAQVRVFSGANGALLASVAVGADFKGGARVAAGDVNGDGKADVVVAAGAGAAPRVKVFDGATRREVYNFLANDATFRGGVFVAAADLNGDGKAEVLTGAGAGGLPEVRVFGGANMAHRARFRAYGRAFTGGVRVAAADVNGDGRLDLVTAPGAGSGQVRAFDARTAAPLAQSTPHGASFQAGLFVGAFGGGSGGGFSTLGSGPVVTVVATTPDTAEGSPVPGVFTVTRTGDLTGELVVTLQVGGTASADDGTVPEPVYTIVIEANSATATIPITAYADGLFEGVETVVATLVPDTAYTVGTPSVAVVSILDNDGPPPLLPGEGAGCWGAGDLVGVAAGQPGGAACALPGNGVRYFDGVVSVPGVDLDSWGFGTPWGLTRGWTNAPWYAAGGFGGNGTVVSQQPFLRRDAAGVVAAVADGCTARFFDPVSGGGYAPRFYLQERLTYDSEADEYTLTDTVGNRLVFHGFGTALPAAQRGQLKRLTDPGNNATTLTYRPSDGKLVEVQRADTTGGVTTTESYLYTYLTSGPNAGRLANVKLQRRVDTGPWSTVRQVDYAYYDGAEANGALGDLKTAVVKDGSLNLLDTKYYRYYTSAGPTGYAGGLKYVFNAESYGRLAAAFDPSAATDAQVAPYADLYLEYDSMRRVTKQVAQGEGCSACAGGLGTYTYSYTTSAFAEGPNNWLRKTVETLPDGNQNVVYTNYAGQVLLHAFKEAAPGGKTWLTFSKYDDAGRVVLTASPSAVSGYDESRPDLLHNQAGNYLHLKDQEGLVGLTSYYETTDATISETVAGGVAGYLYQRTLQRGEVGTAATRALQSTAQYFARTGGGATVYPVAAETVYRNADGTGAQTTSYAYTWVAGTTHAASVTVTRPAVSAGQNGPGTADQEVMVQDAYGRPVWSKDGDGYLHYAAYDPATGAVVKTITDVDTTRTSDFAGLPTGWETPSGGGLHLVTLAEVDPLGRTTKLTDPEGRVTYMVYNDAAHEVRTYRGWQGGGPTGPTEVVRMDRARSYTETLTMSAAPAVVDGRPTGTEAIASVQTLSRTYTSAAGQVSHTDEYFHLPASYSADADFGAEGTDFYRTRYGYDNPRGWLTRVQLPTGTIQRTVYDALGRVSSEWVGTNDTPGAGGLWSPTNNGPPANMVKVVEYAYDGGGVGDGNLTQETQLPGGGAAARVTQSFYDWRNRLVATKAGVQATEGLDTQRPITYTELDNLGQAFAQELYDGDNVTITDANGDGVPDKPDVLLLRARSTASFDDQGRVYQTKTFSVNQATGAASANALTADTWYDRRGQAVKVAEPGGLVTKVQYDGAGRATKTFTTDGGGDTAWADVFHVTGDAVLEQAETQYDKAGNALLVTARQRFHDEAATGALGDPTTGPKARVSYTAYYYDAAGRLTDAVDVGTNGGAAYTRPGAAPARSDTVLVTSYGYNAAGWAEAVTDPRDIVTKTFYDALGRTTKTVEAFEGTGTPTDTTNKTTEYTYDGSGHLLTLKVVLPGTDQYQTTQWVYGVSTGVVSSNDLLAEVRYPDKATGDPGALAADREGYDYNALGEVTVKRERNRNAALNQPQAHAYSYDVLGRLTADAVTVLGDGVDGSVRHVETAYDTAGRPYLFTSFDAAAGGVVVNQVRREYNGLGQLVTEWQATSGAVNTATTPRVQYAYSEMAGGNHSRLVSMTYPGGRRLDYNYTGALDNAVSRLSSISDASPQATLESYSYLGLGAVVVRSRPQPGVDLTYVKQAGDPALPPAADPGDQYTGLDRFGRVVDQRWVKAGDATPRDRLKYGYDRGGNRLYRENAVDALFSELYGYDALGQLTGYQRGQLNEAKDAILGTPTRSQGWTFDALGNFATQATGGDTQAREHNRQNQVTSVSGQATPAYDSSGNMTADETGKTLVYDAWNRLAAVKQGATTLAAYAHDALGRRVTENTGTARALYYSAGWQVVEEREGGVVRVQTVFSPVYVDAVVLRDRDADGVVANGLEERLYALQDANWNVTALVDTAGAVVERFVYDPYGAPTVLTPTWGARAASLYGWVVLHQGGRRESASGLYDFRNRWLSPTLGRWVQRDPLEFDAGDANLYRFVGNGPTTVVDPWGLKPFNPPWTQPANPVVRYPAHAGSASLPSSGYWPGKSYAALIAEARRVGVPESEIQVALGAKYVMAAGSKRDPTEEDLVRLIKKYRKTPALVPEASAEATRNMKLHYETVIKDTSKDPCRCERVRGPYSFLAVIDKTEIKPRVPFSPKTQKPMVIMANWIIHGGRLRSDDSKDEYLDLRFPVAFPLGGEKKVDLDRAEVDHIFARSKGGTNSLCNARVISNWLNQQKRDH